MRTLRNLPLIATARWLATRLEARPMNSRPHVGLIRSQWEAIARRPDGREETVLTMEGWGMFRRREAPAAQVTAQPSP